jgi:hypothetical protein
MIAESQANLGVANAAHANNDDDNATANLSASRIVAALQLLLATRRAARNEEHAYWYTVARGM